MKLKKKPENKIIFAIIRREMPLNISEIPIKAGIQKFVGTRQQIIDIMAFRPLEYQKQKHIY
jgi:hypothetical protein